MATMHGIQPSRLNHVRGPLMHVPNMSALRTRARADWTNDNGDHPDPVGRIMGITPPAQERPTHPDRQPKQRTMHAQRQPTTRLILTTWRGPTPTSRR